MASFEQRIRDIALERRRARSARETNTSSAYPDNRLWLYSQAIKNTQRRCRRTL